MQDYNGGRTLDDFVKFLEPEGAAEVSTFLGSPLHPENYYDFQFENGHFR